MLCLFNRKILNPIYILQIGVSLLFISSILFTSAEASREVSGKRECSTCHIMWLKDFNRKDVTPLIPYEPEPVVATGKQDVSSTNKMCFSCHDGFVLASRSVWKAGTHSHPVGVKPSGKIKFPTSEGKTIFPLNEDGKIYCGTCHTAHGVDWSQSESPVFLRVKNVESSMCLACHLEKSTGPKEGNHPIFKKPEYKPDTLLQAGSKFSKDGGVICQSCHNPHSTRNKNILIINNHDSGLCVTCHKDKKVIKNTKHDLNKTAPDATNKKGKTVSETGVCAACHLPHNANDSMLWARQEMQTNDSAAARCLTCHRKDGLAKEKIIGEHSHPTMVSIKKAGIEQINGKWRSKQYLLSEKNHINLPLYNSAGNKTDTGGKVSCGSCHDPHVWSKEDLPSQSDDGELFEGNDQSSFLRIRQDKQSALCINCHLKQKTILSSRHNILNNSEIEQKDILKGGTCGQCHVPHNALGSYLRAREYPAEKGSFSRLCISCHRKGGIAEDKQIGKYTHPVGVDLKNLNAYTGNLPLYDKDGNKVSESGLVDCVSCHDAHNWEPPSVAKKLSGNKEKNKSDQEGDASNSFLRITAAHDSKLCVECHKDKKRVIGSDHDMSVVNPAAVNHQGQDVAHSGVCGQCHSVHNATLAINLWAREPDKSISIVDQMCLSCHQKGKVAKDKVPPELQHPDHIKVWSNQIHEKRITGNSIPDIPVFNKEGRRVHVGLISCLSCHDPHQWQAGKGKVSSRKNEEGDAMNSFLRNKNSELIVCANCHGADAIFRYKYFHGETSRKKYPLYQ